MQIVTFPASSCPSSWLQCVCAGSSECFHSELTGSVCQQLRHSMGPQLPRRLLLGLLTVLDLSPPVRTDCVNSPSLHLLVFSTPSFRLVALFIFMSYVQYHHLILLRFCCECVDDWVWLLEPSLRPLIFIHPIIFQLACLVSLVFFKTEWRFHLTFGMKLLVVRLFHISYTWCLEVPVTSSHWPQLL